MGVIYQERLLTAKININTAGDNVVITPGAGEMPATWENSAVYIAIDSIFLVPQNTVSVQFNQGTIVEGQTTYGGAYDFPQNFQFSIQNVMANEHGIITLAPNKSFVINLSVAVQVSGFIRYRLLATN